jgi:hypothetical protein
MPAAGPGSGGGNAGHCPALERELEAEDLIVTFWC